ncbi:unnamed protein product [Notodromas monacha]|uniref:Thioesterase domain-containing protein n=1 Tax=Notodromas monacha TaxID=399045 RepID=A0A7R9C4B5_9CRUS|nr:unnamed protein product [Notodromas monacha]CAG0925975.1 unnamed protein product [Notodromas monacha]
MTENTIDLENINAMNKNTLMETLGIEFTYFDGETIKAKMPVGPKVHQPFGILHGGATAALVETLGSSFSNMIASEVGKRAVGTDISVKHFRSQSEGWVEGEAKFSFKGGRLHVLDVVVYCDNGKILSKGTMTNMII